MTDNHSTSFIRHFLYVFGSQVVVLVTGFIKALIIPVVLGIADYGYWQIYVFYAAYIGVFTFGYNEGIYLKYGGNRLESLPLPSLRTANGFYVLLLALGTAAVAIFAAGNADPGRQYIFYAVAANVAVLGITSNISLTLQAANRLKGFALLNAADKIFFTLALFALINDAFRTFHYLIAIDIFSKVLVTAVLLYRYRQLFIGTLAKTADGVLEFASSLGAGVQLLVANLSGMLVLGFGRIIVEYFGAHESYAYYAFAMSLANVVLISIPVLSVVIYPALKRQPRENFLGIFKKTNNAYSLFALLMLAAYFPALGFIQIAAKNYAPVVEFLNVMFVIMVLQGKMQLVNSTYYNALRLERSNMVANLSSMLIAMALSAIAYALTHSVLAIAYATLVTMLIRVYASEVFLRRHMGEAYTLRSFAEGIVLAIFLVLTTNISPMIGGAAWFIFIVMMAIFNRDQLAALPRQFRDKPR